MDEETYIVVGHKKDMINMNPCLLQVILTLQFQSVMSFLSLADIMMLFKKILIGLRYKSKIRY